MEALTYSRARQELAQTMDRVCGSHEPVIITRQKSDSVVLMILEDYESLQETANLLRAPRNVRRLLEAMAELESGQGVARELRE